MNRYFRALRQHQHAGRHFTWPYIDIKKLAMASVVTALAVSGGTTLLANSPSTPTLPKPQTVSPSTSTTSSHPLLGLDDSMAPLPGLQESTKIQQTNPQPDTQSSATDNITNRVMHQTTVTINGESIEIPPSGSSHQTLKNQDGTQTQVDIQHDQTQIEGMPKSNITIDSRTRSSSSSTSLNSRITITH